MSKHSILDMAGTRLLELNGDANNRICINKGDYKLRARNWCFWLDYCIVVLINLKGYWVSSSKAIEVICKILCVSEKMSTTSISFSKEFGLG